MRKKRKKHYTMADEFPTSVSSVKWTGKNQAYLESLNMISKGTGRKKGNVTHSRFINECVTFALEHPEGPKSKLKNTDELKLAWRRIQIANISRQISDLRDKAVLIAEEGSLERYPERLRERLFSEILNET